MLLITLKIACGLVLGQGKIPLDTLKAPKRIIYNQDKGIFLTKEQEELTLDKLQWKEIYKSDALTLYYINLALEDRIKDLTYQRDKANDELFKCETNTLNTINTMTYYKDKYNEIDAVNKELVKKNKQIVPLKIGAFTLGVGTATFGILYLFERIN